MRQGKVFRAFHHGIRDRVVLAAYFSEGTQQKTRCEQTDSAAGNVLFGDHAQCVRVHNMLISAAAVQVTAGFQRHGDRLLRRSRHLVVLVEVPDRPAVRNKMSLKAPFAAEFFHQHTICTAGLSVHAVVSSHHRFDAGILHQRLKSREIGLFHVPGCDNRVKAVAYRFRPAVCGKMLSTGGSLQGFAFPLQTAHKGAAQRCSQAGVFTVGLVSAAPAGIPENVDIR